MAISSGMEVIFTRLAKTVPTNAPTTINGMSQAKFVMPESSVAAMAIVMPMMPKTLPRLAVSCVERPLRLSTNSTPATR